MKEEEKQLIKEEPQEINLYKMKSVLFFVYGTLKANFYNHGRLDRPRVEYLGEFVTEPKYTMVNCGAYPAVLEKGSTGISGELYRTDDPSVVRSVCMLEGFNGIKNHPSNSFYDITEVETPFGTAYMFIFKKDFNLPVIPTGHWSYRR